MELSHRATQALVTGAVGLVVVITVRFALDFSYSALRETPPAERSGCRRTAPDDVQLRATGDRRHSSRTIAVWQVLSLYDITSEIGKALLASSAVLALFAGLAFSTPLSNLGSGLLVAFTQPLRLGDRITVDGETGFVEEMALIYTTLVTDDARRIFIPNTTLTTNKIIQPHDPRPSPTRRGPLPRVRSRRRSGRRGRHCSTTITTLPGTIDESAHVFVGEISDRTVWLEVAVYTPLDADVVSMASDLREVGLRALRDNGFLAA